MKTIGLVAAAAILVFAAGCIRSIQPFYTEEDVIFDPGLVGTWSEEGSKETWEFSKGNENEYRLVYTDDKGKSGAFVIHLLKIDGKMFMDFFPEDPDLPQNDFYRFHLLPVHSFAYVAQIAPSLRMSFPDPDWLKETLAADPQAIAHERIEGDIILTASTRKLQAFWLKNLQADGAFGNFSDMLRNQPNAEDE